MWGKNLLGNFRAKNILESLNGLQLLIFDWLKGCMEIHMLEGFGQITERACNIILMIVAWYRKIRWEKRNCVGDALTPGSRDVGAIAAVVVWSMPNIPCIHTVLGPGLALLWCFVDQSLYSRRSHRRVVVVKYTVQVSICRHMWVLAGLTEHV